MPRPASAPLLRSLWPLVLAGALAGGCGPKIVLQGVIDAPAPAPGAPPTKAALIQPDGRRHPLALRDDAFWLRDLGGCSVQIEGREGIRRLHVERWVVTDAGDGSQPYLGTLERAGLQVILRDRQTQAAFILDPETVGELADHIGAPVLVVGFIAGPNRLRVMSWRALRPLPPPM